MDEEMMQLADFILSHMVQDEECDALKVRLDARALSLAETKPGKKARRAP